jgi:hypothetical protein
LLSAFDPPKMEISVKIETSVEREISIEIETPLRTLPE